MLTHRFTRPEAADWHDASARADAGPAAPETVRLPDLMVTAGVLGDGRRFYTRSDRTGDGWATVYLAGGPDATGALNLIASSIRPGARCPGTCPGAAG